MSGNSETNKRYAEKVKRLTPSSDFAHGYIRAFWVGGLICCIGQALALMYEKGFGIEDATASTLASVTLIFLGVLLTGLGVYDDLGKYAGAGSVVPITGFANSMASPAMEFRREGLVMGVGAKLFSLAGPVLAYGISVSIIIGVVYYFIGG